MAQKRKAFDQENKNRLKERAWESLKEFFGKREEARPLNPETVAQETSAQFAPADDEANPHMDRLHRPTEQRRINESPANTWPG